MKKIIIMMMSLLSTGLLACPKALPTDDVNFCSSFKSVATCYCTSSGLPSSLCQDTRVIYQRMIAMFQTLEKACEYQKYTSKQDCMDNWNCYLFGGVDSRGRICSSTQKPCA
jgi:hypothetical protein